MKRTEEDEYLNCFSDLGGLNEKRDATLSGNLPFVRV